VTAGAILAGGRSRRFGSDKARALLDGDTFLARVAGALQGAGLSPVYVVGGGAADLPTGTTHLPDRFPGEGPLGGVLTALLAHDGDVIVTACDMPRLQTAAVARLLEFAAPEPVSLAIWRGAYQPLFALYRRAAALSLAEDFAAGERSLLNALAHLPLREVPFADEDLSLTNVNRPEDLAGCP